MTFEIEEAAEAASPIRPNDYYLFDAIAREGQRKYKEGARSVRAAIITEAQRYKLIQGKLRPDPRGEFIRADELENFGEKR